MKLSNFREGTLGVFGFTLILATVQAASADWTAFRADWTAFRAGGDASSFAPERGCSRSATRSVTIYEHI
ncbi:MAG: hypothetical protein WBD31_28470 [Rubripirellula sp.]